MMMVMMMKRAEALTGVENTKTVKYFLAVERAHIWMMRQRVASGGECGAVLASTTYYIYMTSSEAMR